MREKKDKCSLTLFLRTVRNSGFTNTLVLGREGVKEYVGFFANCNGKFYRFWTLLHGSNLRKYVSSRS